MISSWWFFMIMPHSSTSSFSSWPFFVNQHSLTVDGSWYFPRRRRIFAPIYGSRISRVISLLVTHTSSSHLFRCFRLEFVVHLSVNHLLFYLFVVGVLSMSLFISFSKPVSRTKFISHFIWDISPPVRVAWWIYIWRLGLGFRCTFLSYTLSPSCGGDFVVVNSFVCNQSSVDIQVVCTNCVGGCSCSPISS